MRQAFGYVSQGPSREDGLWIKAHLECGQYSHMDCGPRLTK